MTYRFILYTSSSTFRIYKECLPLATCTTQREHPLFSIELLPCFSHSDPLRTQRFTGPPRSRRAYKIKNSSLVSRVRLGHCRPARLMMQLTGEAGWASWWRRSRDEWATGGVLGDAGAMDDDLDLVGVGDPGLRAPAIAVVQGLHG
jgi:hypothetical protein